MWRTFGCEFGQTTETGPLYDCLPLGGPHPMPQHQPSSWTRRRPQPGRQVVLCTLAMACNPQAASHLFPNDQCIPETQVYASACGTSAGVAYVAPTVVHCRSLLLHQLCELPATWTCKVRRRQTNVSTDSFPVSVQSFTAALPLSHSALPACRTTISARPLLPPPAAPLVAFQIIQPNPYMNIQRHLGVEEGVRRTAARH